MPEGHTIHRLARDHHKWLKGTIVQACSPQGRFEDGARRMDGARFKRAYAHGKHLFYELITAHGLTTVHIHLGLYGRFRTWTDLEREPTPNVRLRLQTTARLIDLSGPTRCELLDLDGVAAVRNRLGPDPLIVGYTADDCLNSFARRRSGIASVLMDQSAIAGLGNIFRSELLFAHRLHPDAVASQLKADTVAALWKTAQEWLNLGVKANAIITTLPPGTTKVPRPRPEERVAIYKASSCPACSGEVTSYLLKQRRVYACLQCQTNIQ